MRLVVGLVAAALAGIVGGGSMLLTYNEIPGIPGWLGPFGFVVLLLGGILAMWCAARQDSSNDDDDGWAP